MEKRAVQVQMLDSTLKTIEDLKEVLHTSNRSEIVKRSVEIAEIVARVMDEGGSVTLKEKGGKEMRLIIPGL